MARSRRFYKALDCASDVHHRRIQRGGLTIISIAAVVALIVAAGGGLWWWADHGDGSNDASIMLHEVKADDFELTVTERGEIEAFDVTDVRSLVKSNNTSGNAILRIVPEGTKVKKGDFLVELDSSALVTQQTTQRIAVNAAKALEVEAKNNYDTAVIAKREYLEGTYLQERQTIESEVFVAEENLNRAKEYFTYSEKLASKGYVNELQLEADRFAVEKANKDLDAAKTKLHVLDEFTKAKMLSTLESAVLIAKAKWDAGQNSYELELQKLHDLDQQVAHCNITAPQDGVVKYAHVNNGRGDQEFIVEEGAIVRERQVIIRLPNADAMRVNLTVNESLVQYIRPGLPASISPVGMGDHVLRGTVDKVNQYAEPTSWRTANVKEYKAFVAIDDPSPDIRTGMTASVTIKCAEVRNTLQVPVQAIYSHGDKFFCFVYDNGRWDARAIKPGPTNDKFFVIESGLNAGDLVAMNPRGYVNQVKLPQLSPEEAQRAVPQVAKGSIQGEAPKTVNVAPPAGGPAGPGAPGAGPPGGPRRGGGPGGEGAPGGGPPGGPGGPGGRRPGGEGGPPSGPPGRLSGGAPPSGGAGRPAQAPAAGAAP